MRGSGVGLAPRTSSREHCGEHCGRPQGASSSPDTCSPLARGCVGADEDTGSAPL